MPNRLQYSVNIIFTYTGKLKNSFDSPYCDIDCFVVVWKRIHTIFVVNCIWGQMSHDLSII